MSTKDKIIVALDVESCDKARSVVESLDGHVNFFKIGLGLIGIGGLELALEMKKQGLHVFLDLKLFEIQTPHLYFQVFLTFDVLLHPKCHMLWIKFELEFGLHLEDV